jgi:hypothetical protein
MLKPFIRGLIAVAVVGLASQASAQETYSFSATSGQVTRVDRGRLTTNAKTCLRLAQGVGCTQAQACTAAGAAGGASCTAAQARAANARIYPATQAGREEFLGFELIVPGLNNLINLAVAFDQSEFCRLFKLATANAQNDVCADVSYTPVSGQCEVCP